MSKADIWDCLTRKYKFTPEITAGIMGNMAVESGFDPEAVNMDSAAFGLCQWLGTRKKALRNFANSKGVSVTDWQMQIDYMMLELTGDPSNGWSELEYAASPGEAAEIFCRRFERPGNDGSLNRRVAAAEEVYAEFS